MITLGILDLLGIYGFDRAARGKLVRHKSGRHPVDELLRRGWLDLYQSYQGRPVFDNLDVIVSFYGTEGTRACLYGVYSVGRRETGSQGPVLNDCPWSAEWNKEARHFYELSRVAGYEALERRVVIDWGKGALSWHQRLANKPVFEILPAGRSLPVFDDYLEFSLSHAQLCDLYANEAAHRDWRSRLEAVAGVYLILAETTGHLYVGSAYGAGGIWGRWVEYARTGHAGNLRLRTLIRENDGYPGRFRFSILQILPKTLSRDEVIRREALYKEKLGSRATGLNLN